MMIVDGRIIENSTKIIAKKGEEIEKLFKRIEELESREDIPHRFLEKHLKSIDDLYEQAARIEAEIKEEENIIKEIKS